MSRYESRYELSGTTVYSCSGSGSNRGVVRAGEGDAVRDGYKATSRRISVRVMLLYLWQAAAM